MEEVEEGKEQEEEQTSGGRGMHFLPGLTACNRERRFESTSALDFRGAPSPISRNRVRSSSAKVSRATDPAPSGAPQQDH